MLGNDELPFTPVARSMLKRPLVSTSTPSVFGFDKNADCNVKRQRRKWLLRPELAILREPNESPIIIGRQNEDQKQQEQVVMDFGSVPVFGRTPGIDSTRFSDTFIASSLDKMNLFHHIDSNSQSGNDKVSNMRKGTIDDKEPEASTSSFQAHEEFKKEINKNKMKKSTTPKNKSPKICKINNTKKMIGFGSASSKTSANKKSKISPKNKKKHVKSPTNKNPLTYKIPHKSSKSRSPKDGRKSPKNSNLKIFKVQLEIVKTENSNVHNPSPKEINQVSSTNLTDQTNVNNHKQSASTSDENSAKKCQSNIGSQCNTLKTSKCPKSPNLHTAARAAIKQHREEIRKEKQKQIDEWNKKILEEQKRVEEKEIQKLRQQTIFKAKPIRKYAPLPIIKKRPLTDPVSPNIYKRRRLDPSHVSSNPSKI